MIKYRFAEIKFNKDQYLLVEVIDYDTKTDNGFFDTIVYNNPEWNGKAMIILDKKIIPSPAFFNGATKLLHSKYLEDGGKTDNLDWQGPFIL